MNVKTAAKPMARREMAKRLADDIPEGWYVNLGIGAPLQVADYVPQEREVVFQSENGILGMGPAPEPDKINRWLINAGKQYITLRTGGSYMHHADSFALIRGGHLDLCVLGAFQVAENGDIANWSTSDNESAPAVGGAMDLAAGARRIWVMMDHTTKTGESRLVRRCTYPLTAVGVVKRVYTNLAVLDVTDDGFAVREMVPGMTLDELQKVTDAPLHMANVARMSEAKSGDGASGNSAPGCRFAHPGYEFAHSARLTKSGPADFIFRSRRGGVILPVSK